MSEAVTKSLKESVESLKNMLTARAMGGATTSDADYAQLRTEVIGHTKTKNRIPSFIRTSRTLDEFWGFIKTRFGKYHERREFIRLEFDPVLTYLETMNRSPADDELTKGLKQTAAEYINTVWEKALARKTDDPEGAITAARTLLQTVCKHLLEELGEAYDDKADLPKLYGMTAAKLNLAPNQHTEQVFKQILGGCHSIVEGLGALRNRLSDAHGKGKAAVRPQPRHAHLAVNLAGATAMFLFETFAARAISLRPTASS